MDPKIKKGLRLAAAAIFVFALALNIKITLDDPFLMMSDKAVASTTSNSNSSSVEYWGWFWKKRYFDVKCGGITWTKTEYFSSSGTLLGATHYIGGVLQAQYNGSYSYSVISSGTTGGIDLKGWQCMDGWSLCKTNINPCDD